MTMKGERIYFFRLFLLFFSALKQSKLTTIKKRFGVLKRFFIVFSFVYLLLFIFFVILQRKARVVELVDTPL